MCRVVDSFVVSLLLWAGTPGFTLQSSQLSRVALHYAFTACRVSTQVRLQKAFHQATAGAQTLPLPDLPVWWLGVGRCMERPCRVKIWARKLSQTPLRTKYINPRISALVLLSSYDDVSQKWTSTG